MEKVFFNYMSVLFIAMLVMAMGMSMRIVYTRAVSWIVFKD